MAGSKSGVKHIVTCKTAADVPAAKKQVEEQGGKVIHDYTIFPGFDVMMPKDSISTLSSSDHIESVELDKEVTIS